MRSLSPLALQSGFESQTDEGEALRHDDQYGYVAAWGWAGEDEKPVLHKEALDYEFTEMKQRSYK